MATKLCPDSITASDLSEYLSSADDFQFELDVFNSCVLREFDAEHGGTYQDPITKKDRQFDIRMTVVKGLCTLKLAIECKNLKANFPLLVSRVHRRQEECFHNLILSDANNVQNAQMLLLPPRAGNKKIGHTGALYRVGELVGKSTAQVGRTPSKEITTKDGEVYEKWAQAIASAFDLVEQSIYDYKKTGGVRAFTMVIPVLVVADDTLWTADYSQEGKILDGPSLCGECDIFIGKDISTPSADYTISHLHVLTKKKFDEYLDRIKGNKIYWDRIFANV